MGVPVRLKRMVRLPDVERPPNRENPGRSNDCGSKARRPVWLAGGFAGRAGAPGENFGRAGRESQGEEDAHYLNL